MNVLISDICVSRMRGAWSVDVESTWSFRDMNVSKKDIHEVHVHNMFIHVEKLVSGGQKQ